MHMPVLWISIKHQEKNGMCLIPGNHTPQLIFYPKSLVVNIQNSLQ